jgi:hypothetical protein
MSGEIQSGTPWVAGPLPTVGDGWVQLGGVDSKKIYWDQLSQADQDKIIEYMLSAQVPVLAPPQEVISASGDAVVGINADKIAFQIASSKHEIISQMLDNWIKSIQEQAERNKRDDEKRVIDGLSIAYHTYNHEVNMKTDPNFPIFAVGLIIAGTGIYQSLAPVVNNLGVEFNPVIDMYKQAVVPVMGDMRAELGLIGALYASGLQYFTVAQIAAEGGAKKPNELEFAKGYAENVVKLIGDASFNAYVMALVTQGTAKGESLSDERVKELAAMVKLVLLASALAMLYKAEAGKMTSLEFAAMINGEIQFAQGDIRAILIALIRDQLQLLSPSIRARIWTSLLEYFDSDPKIEALGDPAKVFAGIYGTLPRGDLEG